MPSTRQTLKQLSQEFQQPPRNLPLEEGEEEQVADEVEEEVVGAGAGKRPKQPTKAKANNSHNHHLM